MLSVATVRSAAGAAAYFANDNYYSAENSSETSTWAGKGAAALGLSGEVTKDKFEALLNGKLPDGTEVNQTESRRAGIDLTFSMPKSASVLAYVSGDDRILDAHVTAVKATMGWIEGKFAEARDYSRTKNGEGVRTGNLVYALFQHDTSRKLDPQGHIHAVIAAVTKTADGTWKALWNGQLWKNNSTIGTAYHAAFRTELEKIGYQVELTGKHGQFEIKGVPKEVMSEFSQRRADILARAAELGRSPNETETMREITKRSRDPKINLEDREVLRSEWKDRAASLGFDGKALIDESKSRSAEQGRERAVGPMVQAIAGEMRSVLGTYFRPSDPLTTNGLARASLTPTEMRTEMAVASALRILGQREAAFAIDIVSKTALDLGFRGVTVDGVENRIEKLTQAGQLIPGKIERLDGTLTHVTTPEHIAGERRLLEGIDAGRGQGPVVLDASAAPARLQAAAGDRPLSGEQLGAAVLALSSDDRIVVIQGVAGAGKSTLIKSMAQVVREEGREVVGVAIARTVAGALRDDTGIEAQTVSSFINAHMAAAYKGEGPKFDASLEALKDKVIVLDEGSLVGTEQMNNLVTIANRMGVDRLVMIGDHKQLMPIDNGKAFIQVQGHEPAIARLETSQRQRTDDMKMVATLTREGKFKEAFEVLGNRVVSVGNDFLKVAVKQWLDLSQEERDRTALYSSGRVSRAALNEGVQEGLRAEGTLAGDGRTLTVLSQVNVTREELRLSGTYKTGQIMDVVRNSAPAGIVRGRYEVVGHDKRGKVQLVDENGRKLKFDPQKIDPTDRRDAISLSARESLKVYEGDNILWTQADKDRRLEKSDRAVVIGVTGDAISVLTAKGETITLAAGDKMLERLGLAYAINMNQAQGMTSDKGIGVMHSSERNLSNQRLTHVMATRVRDNITIVTNDRDQLLRTIRDNPGNKASALETIGEKSRAQLSAASGKSGDFNPQVPPEMQVAPGRTAASFRMDPSMHPTTPKAPEQKLNVPEKTIDLSL